MPSPPHLCAFPGCTKLVKRKEACHCRNHFPRTPEHIAKQAAANRGTKRSVETRAKLSAIRRGPGELNRTCERCEKAFTVNKPSERKRFCNASCQYAVMRTGCKIPSLTCRVCGKKFQPRSHTMLDKRFTCSYLCKNIWQKTHQKRTGTDIELLMERALIERQWKYRSQVGMCNICTVDFYLPKRNAIIFCDGNYWHSLPDHVERDNRQTLILQAAGYTVFRFWGTEIKADISRCLDIVSGSTVRALDVCA